MATQSEQGTGSVVVQAQRQSAVKHSSSDIVMLDGNILDPSTGSPRSLLISQIAKGHRHHVQVKDKVKLTNFNDDAARTLGTNGSIIGLNLECSGTA